jgi:predicted permease
VIVEILAIIAPVFICAALGVVWARSGQAFENEFITRLVMWVGAPCLIVGTLGTVDVSLALLAEIALAVIILLLLTAALAIIVCRMQGLPWRNYLPSLVFPNTGNMGLPLALFAFGEQGLAVALTIFMIISVAQFTLGVAILSGHSPIGGALRSPVVYAGLLSVVLIAFDWQLPAWLQNTLSMLGNLSIPLMLLALGVSLAGIKRKYALKALKLGSLRLLLGFGVGWLVAEMLGLTGVLRGVLIIQSTMPVAVFNYLLAIRYRKSPEEVAGAVMVSTLLSFATLPALLWFVLP